MEILTEPILTEIRIRRTHLGEALSAWHMPAATITIIVLIITIHTHAFFLCTDWPVTSVASPS